MHKVRGKTCGVGINDADYVTQRIVNGKKVCCKIYSRWYNMILRCYGEKHRYKFKSYEGCTVCDEWLTFSNFKAWMERQDWEDKDVDKDLLFDGNKIYSPETCCLLDRTINTFINQGRFDSRNSLTGVSWKSEKNKFVAQCRNPFNGKNEFIGYFLDEELAHQAWKRKKLDHAILLTERISDTRIAQAILMRYS